MIYFEQKNQVENDELDIGTSTRLLLYELEDEVAGASVEHNFSSVFVLFMKQVSKKKPDKFPCEDKVIKELAFLDPCNRTKISTSGIINIATRFT